MRWIVCTIVCFLLLGCSTPERAEYSAASCPVIVADAEGPFRVPSSVPSSSPQKLEKATFSMGCFWGTEALFGSLPGVVSTRVGYTGGVSPSPHYGAIGDHAEAVEVTFDADQLSYQELLAYFWNHHNPKTAPVLRQYSNAVFVHDAEQQQKARQVWKERGGGKTAVIEAGKFHPAEDYHQKYYLRQVASLKKAFPSSLDSTLAARVNGFAAGKGLEQDLLSECERMGLDQASTSTLLGLYREMHQN